MLSGYEDTLRLSVHILVHLRVLMSVGLANKNDRERRREETIESQMSD